MRLKDKVAIITGAASGIGLEIAHAYAREGAHVAIADLKPDAAAAAAEDVRKHGQKSMAVAMDVTKEDMVNAGVDQVASDLGRVDIAKKPYCCQSKLAEAEEWLESVRCADRLCRLTCVRYPVQHTSGLPFCSLGGQSMKKLLAATATPLASIFGSGFLVIVPILNGAVGKYAIFAMALVCAVAYAVGSVIRFNIVNAEPLIENDEASHRTKLYERASDLALVAAYVISVCLYINILASFLLGGIGEQFDTIRNEHLVSVVVIGLIGAVGYYKGLAALASLEKVALGVTLLIIVALFAGFASYDVKVLSSGIEWPRTPSHSWWEILTIVAGTLIVVQGFETSRYLGKAYDSQTRIKSCRLSQIIATVVYLVFIALATPLMHFLGDTVKDNDLIMLAGKASVLLPLPLVIAAVLSQFSAAVADTFGGAGNAVEATHGHVDVRHATLLICGGAIVLCLAPTLTILALASRAFAFYYMLQCFVAASLAKTTMQKTLFTLMAFILAFVTLFAVAAG